MWTRSRVDASVAACVSKDGIYAAARFDTGISLAFDLPQANLEYGDGSFGYSVDADSPANVDTPFELSPDLSPSTVLSTLVSYTEQGIQGALTSLAGIGNALSTSLPATSSR